MSRQKLLIITTSIIVLIFTLILSLFLVFSSEERNFKLYKEGLSSYNGNDFAKCYASFSKVSGSSKFKQAAIYRQALCAEREGDYRASMSNYKKLIKRYPNSKLSIRAKYLKAQAFYDSKDYKKAKKEFKKIVKQHKDTDYAAAAEYYLGSIDILDLEKTKNEKKRKKIISKASAHFKNYLSEAPAGRFSVKSIQKWTSVNNKLTNEDNLLIAKSYQANQDYKNAQKYLMLTNIGSSWTYFVKNAYALKDYKKVKYYTVLGLKTKENDVIAINQPEIIEQNNKNVYEAVDTYLKISEAPKTSLSYLFSISKNSIGNEYLHYKNCINMPTGAQIACFNSLYYKYPNGQFSAEALSNIFYDKVQSKDYFSAKKLGMEHLRKFKNVNSSPRVMFWLAKTAERSKNYEESRSFYKTLISKFPDDYYAYHAFLNLNKFRHPFMDINDLEGKEVLFPYKRNSQNDLIINLTEVEDYGLINELCKDDEFVQSWLAYKEGNFSTSARIARDAMEKLDPKPDRNDFRWRLVYPIHYFDLIQESAYPLNNSPILILSIIREESYFNPLAKSAVGASGLMQLMPSTAKEVGDRYGIKMRDAKFLLEPDINIRLGNVYYSQLKRALLNRDVLAVLAYNGGIGSVTSWKENLNYTDVDDFVEKIPYPETQNYLKKVYKSYWNYVRIYVDGDS